MELSHVLKQKRIKSKLSQMQVAEKLGYKSPQFVSNWERGLSHPPVSSLRNIAKLYHTSSAELFELFVQATLVQVEQELRSRFKTRIV